ncbi:MAG: alkaline phosphatase PhoX, partial [Gaiellales bacterium]
MSISRTWMVPAVLGCGLVFAGAAVALTGVPAAQPKSPGVSLPNILARGLAERVVARGSMRLENGTAAVPRYGYDGDGPLLPAPGDLPSPTHLVEATKTEPDKNTYLVLRGQRGADRSYAYGTHFLFQGHEAGAPGYITRVNLDANAAHRVTLLATTEATGAPLPPFDGSTWDPWAKRLLFTSEGATQGGVWQATAQFPSTVRALAGSLGNAGYEGIQNDPAGDLWIVEDVGGAFGTTNPHAKQPNSFLYRFVPAHPSDLTAGRLQVLQVMSKETGRPIIFHPGQADADITSPDTRDLNSYGMSFHTRWVTIHDTATDGTAPFDANALA